MDMQLIFFKSESNLTINGQPVVQPTTTIVYESAATRRFGYVSYFTIDGLDKRIIKIASASSNSVAGDPELQTVIKQIFSGMNIDTSLLANCTANSGKTTTLLKTYNNVFMLDSFSGLTKYNFDSTDSVGQTLKDYLDKNFMFEEAEIIQSPVVNNTVKYAVPRKADDFDLFWNSPDITDEEKQLATAIPDLDISQSNANKTVRKVLERLLYVDYPERKWVFNILHGDPASGKTTMVINDLCAINHIPYVKFTGDPQATIQRMLSIIGPATVNGKVELTKIESLWLKCLRLNLPLVVVFDEIDLFNTQQMSLLADTITSGHASVGVDNYRNIGNTIRYFGCYNPGTVKSSEFDGKFRDRALFFSIDPIDTATKISHKQRKVKAAMGQGVNLSKYTDAIDKLINANPSNASKLNNIKDTLAFVCQVCPPSDDALDWYVKKVQASMSPKPVKFKSGKFTSYYAGDVQLASVDDCLSIYPTIYDYVQFVNDKLYDITRGADTKNSSKNSAFYIPNRAMDYFIDLIFCFHSTLEATRFFVYNMLPGGFTLRTSNTKAGGRVDTAPSDITKSLSQLVEKEAKKVDLVCFSSTSITDCQKELTEMTAVNITLEVESALKQTAGTLNTAVNQGNKNISKSYSDDLWDEAENL